jgi:restriction endonuclease Mrr
VECKNYDESRIIGIQELRNRYAKTMEISGINEVIFVTTSEFSSELSMYATQYNISLWDGKKLREEFFQLKLGRVPANSGSRPVNRLLLKLLV